MKLARVNSKMAVLLETHEEKQIFRILREYGATPQHLMLAVNDSDLGGLEIKPSAKPFLRMMVQQLIQRAEIAAGKEESTNGEQEHNPLL